MADKARLAGITTFSPPPRQAQRLEASFMFRKSLVVLMCAAAAAVGLGLRPQVVAASPDTPCAERNNVVNTLDSQYKESPRAIGLVSKEAVLEIFVSNAGTWTVVVTDPRGVSCVLAAGQSWEEIPMASKAPGA